MVNKKAKAINIKKDDVFVSWSPTFKDAPGGDLNEYRQYIYDHVKFSDVLRALKLRPEECSTNRYSHRMICPFKFHKNGRERTGSFRFSDEKKIFTCFGCNESGDILKFLSLYCGGYEQFHLKKLISFAGLSNNIDEWTANKIEPDEDLKRREEVYRMQFNAGILLRDHLKQIKKHKLYLDECEWADRMFIKIDKYFDGIMQDNIEEAQKLFDKLTHSISKRRIKLGI